VATTSQAGTRYPALRHRNFTLIWSGLLISNMGTWMQNVAQSWLIYKLTGNNPIYLGFLGLSFAIPMIVAPPIGGATADRVDRIKLLYITQTSSALLAALLAVLTWTGAIRPAYILLTSFAGALLLAFDNPTRQALIPELVPRQDLLNALSLNSATYTGAALVGPALAGLLLDLVGAGWLFMFNAISYIAVLAALRFMRDLPSNKRPRTSIQDALFGGFVYAWQHRTILFLLVLSALAALFGRSYQQLLPVFADAVWRTGAGGYGTLLSAGGAGALIGAFAMSSMSNIQNQGRVLVVSGVIFCVVLAAFALSPWFWVGVALLVAVGISSTVFTTMIATIIQLRVPSELRGRVISLYAITLIGLPSLGALGVARVAQDLGAPHSGWSAGIISLLDLLGITRLTAELGGGAGAPRAIVVGALALVIVLVLTAPKFFPLRAATEAPTQSPASSGS